MYISALIIFLVCTFLVFYTYVVFPWILRIFSGGKILNEKVWDGNQQFPGISVLIAAYNEEKVIEGKIRSVLACDYPADRLEILVGSDASDDKTAGIVQELLKAENRIRFMDFRERRGKPSVINDLVRSATHEIVILTDANVFFRQDALKGLARHFKNGEIGLVGANILNVGQMNDGISHQETMYIARENRVKYHEGILFGTMMGPFGGCFAVRKNLFAEVPAHFLVDDFYICMQVLRQGYKSINELHAVCFEDVSNDIEQEYRRKARISAGNFQNLFTFRDLLLKPFTAVGFCFISHKVLRWLTPFFLLTALITLAFLSFFHEIFLWLFLIECLLLLSPLLDAIFRKTGVHNRILRFVSYFSYMNLALLHGFFRYLSGIKSSIWTPTSRNSRS